MGVSDSKDDAENRVTTFNELPDKIKQVCNELNIGHDNTTKILKPVLEVVNTNVPKAMQQMIRLAKQENQRKEAEETQAKRKESVLRQLQAIKSANGTRQPATFYAPDAANR